MKSLAALLLAVALPLAACSADETATTGSLDAAALDAPADVAARVKREDQPSAEPARLAQADPAPTGDTPAAFQEGKHYVRLTPAQPTSSEPGQVEVAEAFMYTCPHCFTFEPFMSRWASGKAEDVSFVRLPVNFNALAGRHLRAYYVAQSLGVLEDIHQAIFDEIHVRKNGLQDEAAIRAFFARHGVAEEAFNEAWNSFEVDTRMRRAETLGRRYKITSVPTVIVNGKYKTDGSMAGSYPRLLEIIDYLVSLEKQG